MTNFIKKSANITIGFFSLIITVTSEELFKYEFLFKNLPTGITVMLNRILFFGMLFILTMFFYKLFTLIQWRRTINGNNYRIVVQYKDIFDVKNSKKVIPFDECYTVDIGDEPGEIKPTSVCGQYLTKNTIVNMQDLIERAKLTPKGKSKYQNKDKYQSGKLIPNQDYLLLSFAKLDKEGLGRMTRNEFIDCLSVLWSEIDKYYGQCDVCIPILGSGITRMNDSALTQQELLDIIIASYKMSASKINKPNKLIIACKRTEGLSLDKIGEYI